MAQKILTLSAGGIVTEVNDAYQGTVTSVAALTLGTTGTDLSSTVAGGTAAAVITLQVPTASAANRGVLSSTDWSTFNGKYTPGTALSATTGIFSSTSSALMVGFNGTPDSLVQIYHATLGGMRIAYNGTAVNYIDSGTLYLRNATGASTWLTIDNTGLSTFGTAVRSPTVKVTSAGGYLSSDNSTGITTTVTTASLVGKTLTIKDGIITGFA